MPRSQFIESLESRRLLTASFDATAGNDTVIIGINGSVTHVVINGNDTTTGDLSIVINAGEGNDSVQVVGTRVGSSITVNGGGGNDTIENIGTDLDATLRGTFLFDGGEGYDKVDADNSGDSTTAASITLQGDAIVKDGSILLSYSHIEDIYFGDSNGPNRIDFIDLQNYVVDPAARVEVHQVTIDANGGDDLIVNHRSVTAAGYLPTSMASIGMTIRGGGGTDALVLDDALNTFFGQYTITSSTFDYDAPFSSTGILVYSDIDSFELVETDGPDVTTLSSQAAGSSIMLETMGGDDAVIVGGGHFASNGFTVANTTIFGGSGTNSIHFDDHLSTVGELYTFDNFTLAAGPGGVTYGGFATQTLDLANGTLSGKFTPTNNVNINAISGQIESTTIKGGANRVTLVNVGNGNLTNVAGSLTLNLNNSALDTLNINDQSAPSARSIVLGASQLTSPIPITFSPMHSININGGPFNDSITITGSAAGTAVTAHGNGGGDIINLGGGSFDDLLSAVTLAGDGGTDTVRFDSRVDPDLLTARLTNGGFVCNGLTHSYNTFEAVEIRTGSGGSDITIQAVPFLTLPAISTTTFIGGSGADLVTIGTGNVGVRGNVLVSGGGGSDSLVLNDSTGSSDNSYTFDVAEVSPHTVGNLFYKGSPTYSVAEVNVEREILQANGGDNTVTVEAATDPLTILTAAGNDRVIVLDARDPVTVNTGGENAAATAAPLGDSIEINTDFSTAGDLSATVLVDQDDSVLALTVARSGTLRIGSGAVLDKTAGTGNGFDVSGTIDLAGGALLSRAGALTPVFRTLLGRGYNGGTWDGTSTSGAINSSLAASTQLGDGVGYGLGSQIGISSIGSFSIAAGDTLLRSTLNGDANLDARVDIADLGILATNWQDTGKTFAQGDFNYDGIVDISDLGMLATNWQQSLPVPSQSALRSRGPTNAPTRWSFAWTKLAAAQPRRSLAEDVGLIASPAT